jgi:hypothetical protein
MEENCVRKGRNGRKLCKERAEWKEITEKAKTPQWVVTPVKEEEEVTNPYILFLVFFCGRQIFVNMVLKIIDGLTTY